MSTVFCAPLARFVLQRMAESGMDIQHAMRQARLPDWVLTDHRGFVPTADYVQLWRLFEHATEDPQIALKVAATSVRGTHGVFGYLFATADTLAAAMELYVSPYVGLISSHIRFELDTTSECETVFLGPPACGGEPYSEATRFGLASLAVRMRQLTGHPVRPVRVAFQSPPPPRHGEYSEIFGCPVDFDAPADSMTLHAGDLARPLRTADPLLASMVRHYAAIIPPPLTRPTRWADLLARELDAALAHGHANLHSVARRLAIGPRTLQRRLAEAGTSWRDELERARHRRLPATAGLSPAERATVLGYADVATMRRAMRRWAARTK